VPHPLESGKSALRAVEERALRARLRRPRGNFLAENFFIPRRRRRPRRRGGQRGGGRPSLETLCPEEGRTDGRTNERARRDTCGENLACETFPISLAWSP